ncbi:hypothetical protein CO174_02655 [Candidatus Uhrbacteria bacterium CG_4_9_14_3_um_filter_50_9]|uniref:Uncharacterized protein n=1 Tax=Candidatus Uhrbacteria bacterium CG_4_9_14_3_um_filter_50_9 TaxID=1975035 RepID=A0A2M7XCG5_9BACT|nr:MAG: hypothetical protein CO174_02655 [Candidatus Uhrbacteria bacterium CG_4_9_14_3_um_filter_50_9]
MHLISAVERKDVDPAPALLLRDEACNELRETELVVEHLLGVGFDPSVLFLNPQSLGPELPQVVRSAVEVAAEAAMRGDLEQALASGWDLHTLVQIILGREAHTLVLAPGRVEEHFIGTFRPLDCETLSFSHGFLHWRWVVGNSILRTFLKNAEYSEENYNKREVLSTQFIEIHTKYQKTALTAALIG